MPEKIVYMIDSFSGPYAGTESQLWYLISELDRGRFEPEIVMLRHSDFSLGEHEWPCPVRVLGIKKILSISGIFQVLKFSQYLRKTDVRILQVFFADASVLGPLLAKLSGVKLVASRRDMGIWYSPAVLAILRMFSSRVDMVIANSYAVKRLVASKERIPENRIQVIYNGLEPLETAKNQTRAIADKRTDSHKKRNTVIGIVANLRPVKRIDDLLRAFRKMREKIHGAHLVVVGGGDLENDLKSLAEELGILDRVEFTGRLDNPSVMIDRFDIAVLCSESEGLSNALMEYLRAGKPVVCTAVGGNQELVKDGWNGFLVRVGDVEALSNALVRIASDKTIYTMLSENAKQSIEDCSVKAMVNRHMKLYSTLGQANVSLEDAEGDPLHEADALITDQGEKGNRQGSSRL